MTIYRRFHTLILFLVFSISSLHAQAYDIEVEIKGLSHDTIVLGEYFTSRMVPKDTLILDGKGKGSFTGKEAFKGGLYLVYIDQANYFDFLLGEDQEISIRADMADLHGSLVFIGDENNRIFQEYKQFLQQERTKLTEIQAGLSEAKTGADSTAIFDRQKQLNLEMEAYMDRLQAENSSLFVSTFIGATREPVIPEEALNGDRRHDDSLRFFYFREHYFDYFDPFDVRLLHTPLYENKIKTYISRVVAQHPDSLIIAVDFLLEGSKVDEELYRYNLITLFNHFAENKYIGMDGVYFHIAEYYYLPDATWSNQDFLDKLRENLELNKPTLIGQPAPNLIMRQVADEHFQMAMQDTAIKKDPHIGHDFLILDIEARFTILYFWEADCGHCKKSTPALHEVYTRMKDQGVQVVSVHVINSIAGKEQWVDFINEYQLFGWINCWSPYSNDFRSIYNLQSYPQLFVIDSDKKIVAKRVTPEQAEQIINSIIASESN